MRVFPRKGRRNPWCTSPSGGLRDEARKLMDAVLCSPAVDWDAILLMRERHWEREGRAHMNAIAEHAIACAAPLYDAKLRAAVEVPE